MTHRHVATRLPFAAVLAFVCVGGGALSTESAAAQSRLQTGVVDVGMQIRRLGDVKRVLMIAAHPDDEDTALLAALARGEGARTAYLSLTRGDGGQNLIGPELGSGLGAVRTGELVAARSLDGGEQFFTRAFDYGFSKSADEAFTRWPKDVLLADVVQVIRTFRPQVIVSVFAGAPVDGHGQHQAAGILAREAFDVAGDASRFTEQFDDGVAPWQADKLYLLARGGRGSPTTFVATGDFDPLLGRSYFQVAMESRSQHRSQDMGVGQALGPQRSALQLLKESAAVARWREEGRATEGTEMEGIFDGVVTSLADRAAALSGPDAGVIAAAFAEYEAALEEAGANLNALDPTPSARALGRAVDALSRAGGVIEEAANASSDVALQELKQVVDFRTGVLQDALRAAAGLVVDVRVADDLVVPGQDVRVEARVWNGGAESVSGATPDLRVPDGWRVEPFAGDVEQRGFFSGSGMRSAVPGESVAVGPGEAVVWRWTVTVPDDAAWSEPYYLRETLDGALYRWPDDSSELGQPGGAPPIFGEVTMHWSELEVPVEAVVEARFVGVDKAVGEFDHPMLVVPALSVEVTPQVLVVPTGSTDTREISVRVTSFAPDPTAGSLRLEIPEGWSVQPEVSRFDVAGDGGEAVARFEVTPPPNGRPGQYTLGAIAQVSEERYSNQVRILDYPHIERVAMFAPAESRLSVFPVAVKEGLKVGYVMGSGDDGLSALQELGVDAALLSSADLTEGDLSRFDVLVLGIRAYEVRPDLVGVNERVLDFARSGGTVIVQYNKYEFPAGNFAPYRVAMSRPHDRVTDENSPVEFIEPGAPVFTQPNRIDTDGDFDGWVTERGLYFLGSWDPRYTPLLALTDPGEEPKTGAIVATPLGEGLWVYTGLSFFRQLPEGVPGAYRLFANLVSLDREGWDAWAERR